MGPGNRAAPQRSYVTKSKLTVIADGEKCCPDKERLVAKGRVIECDLPPEA
jgi:hypothetical protein